MRLQRQDFADFFAALHDGHRPFRWQERLLDSVVNAGRWPGRLVAPTGAGKTSVIDVHVFAQALAAAGEGPRLPRRLAMVVDRRVLVDDQFEYALRLATSLAQPQPADRPSVLVEVARLLWTMRRPDPAQLGDGAIADSLSPLVVGRLRGGSPPSRTWRDVPTAVTVVCATPDMWGSRLLFRGYGSSALAWPREAGMLAMDSVVVVDEAHLARQLLCTARRVGHLAAIAENPVGGVHLQVVETTATPAHNGQEGTAVGITSVGVEDGDLDDATLAARLTRPKPVALVPVKGWDKAASPSVSALADSVLDLLASGSAASGTAPTVGCFVNTVARAVSVTAELRCRTLKGRSLRVVMVCGQVRPIDLDRLRVQHPGLLTPEGNTGVDVLVSTQSLEVGVDLDLAAMVTELASGSALAQRAGRVNRRGLRDAGPVVVTFPEGADTDAFVEAISDKTRSGPYEGTELREALAWLQRCAVAADGLAPWVLREHVPPVAQSRRELFQRPELAEVWHWARTSDELAAEPELDLWLAEDFAHDTSVGFVVRDAMPDDSADAIALVSALRPRAHEVFSVPYRTAIAALRHLSHCSETEGERRLPSVIKVRGDDVGMLEWAPADDGQPGERPRLRPGDLIVLDACVELFTASGAEEHFCPPVVVPADEGIPQPDRERAADVLEAQADLPVELWQQRAVGGVVHRIEIPPPSVQIDPGLKSLFDALKIDDGPLSDRDERRVVRDWLLERVRDGAPSGMVAAAADLLSQAATRSEVIVHRDVDDRALRVLVLDRRRAAADEGVRQVWTPLSREVSLTAHQQAVADRAALLGEHLGLAPELVEALRLAGAHHDDGKCDPRFQRRLGAGGGVVLAKSRAGTTAAQSRRNEHACGLPSRWRHEQRSVLESWDAARGADGPDPQLVMRLVGTSHGHGRSGFPHAASELLLPDGAPELHDLAQRLFDGGDWDHLIEQTQYRYGVWGCAYLEAILRAADGQISEEGS